MIPDTPPAAAACFHCGLPIPAGVHFGVELDGVRRPLCCRGCEAVADAIIKSGLTDYYRYRTEAAPTGRELVPEFLRQAGVYDNPAVQQSFVRVEPGDVREASLILEGITCAACVWLNEKHLAGLPGVLSVQINYATHRARVRWDEQRVHLSEILLAVSRIGYLAHPYDPGRQQQILEHERRQRLRRLSVAGVLGMQIMILAVAQYAGAWTGIDAEFVGFFHWLGLILTLPIVFYSAQPFFSAAWRDLRHLRTGMDVPVSLGIALAFGGSAWATLHGSGEVYYDSVAMFVFFLLSARYFELTARKRAAEASESLVHMTPAVATRLTPAAQGYAEAIVPVAELQVGDRVLVRAGESVPADGPVVEGRSSVDESLLTGESLPVTKQVGAPLVGGSINVESPLHMVVEHTGQDTVVSAILRLLDRAQTEKPVIAQLADRTAAWFVAVVITITVAVGTYWWHAGNPHWLQILIAMLVVTCPCALSLATPTAVTAATGALTRRGLLTTRGHALETLARATHFVFDKTGTLTLGRLRLLEIRPLGTADSDRLLAWACALEQHSEHPVAHALLAASTATGSRAADVVNTPGAGVRGIIDHETFYIGTPAFLQASGAPAPAPAVRAELQRAGNTVVFLATPQELLGAFVIGDAVRPDAAAVVQSLKAMGKHVILLTGDHELAARRIGATVGIDQLAYDLKPDAKLAYVKRLQADGAVVAMIGDGINDAAALAGAHVSIAMGGGAQLAAASADMILLSGRLTHLVAAVDKAVKTLRIIRQNFLRALVYNFVALPAAALGYVPPWLAAVGMSASSLMVVLNALRLVDKPAASVSPSHRAP
jgi:Cu2+-exporting ATPase